MMENVSNTEKPKDHLKNNEHSIAIESLNFGDSTINFFDFENFDPKIDTKDVEIPLFLQSYFGTKNEADGTLNIGNEMKSGSSTYFETIQDPQWKEKLFVFIDEYLNTEGNFILDSLEIDSIKELTPKKIAQLSIAIVKSLSHYSYKNGLAYGEEADHKSCTELLQEGLDNKGDSKWIGNGVCRNFSCNVKAVFETLKSFQIDNSLKNSYCAYTVAKLYEIEKRGYSYEPGHAWNTFFTLNENKDVNIIEMDATWSDNEKILLGLSSIDYTEQRLEIFLHKLSTNYFHKLNNTEIAELLTHYEKVLAHKNNTKKEYYLKRLRNILEINKDFDTLTKGLKEKIRKSIPENINLKKIKKGVNIWNKIEKGDKRFIKMILEEISDNEKFRELIDSDMEIRTITRKYCPEFFRPFSPEKDTVDLKEMLYKLEKSIYFKKYLVGYLHETAGRNTNLRNDIKPENAKKIMELAREVLRDTDPELFDKNYKDISYFELISNFDSLYKTLKEKTN